MTRHSLPRLVLLSLMLLTAWTAQAEEALEWRKISDRNGIQVFVSYDENSRLKTFRGITRMELPDEYAMLALYDDVEAFPQWLHMIDEADLLAERSLSDRDMRFTIRLPWPLNDREVLLTSKLVQVVTEEEESVTAYLEGNADMAPLDENFVRVPELSGVFRFQRVAPLEVEATYQISADLGGYLPMWIVNFAFRDIPYFTLEKMRRIVVRDEYQAQYFADLDLMGPGRPADLPPALSYINNTGVPAETDSQTP